MLHYRATYVDWPGAGWKLGTNSVNTLICTHVWVITDGMNFQSSVYYSTKKTKINLHDHTFK